MPFDEVQDRLVEDVGCLDVDGVTGLGVDDLKLWHGRCRIVPARGEALLAGTPGVPAGPRVATARQILENPEVEEPVEDEPAEPDWEPAPDPADEWDEEDEFDDEDQEDDLEMVSPIAAALGVEPEPLAAPVLPAQDLDDESIFGHITGTTAKGKGAGARAYLISFLIGGAIAAVLVYKFGGWHLLF